MSLMGSLADMAGPICDVHFTRASASSRLSRAISEFWPAADELTGRDVSVPLGRFGAAGLRRRGLTNPTLERRRIAFPMAQDKAL
jgi:hypothetical protein